MGVDISTYRCSIGTFQHGPGLDVILLKVCVNYQGCLYVIGAVTFIALLLLMAGIEENPGPLVTPAAGGALTMQAGRFQDKRYGNWLKVGLSLVYLKEGLEDFAEKQSKSLHTNIQTSLKNQGRTSLMKGKACTQCTSKDIGKQARKWVFKIGCRVNVCDIWMDEILKYHVHLPCPNVSWDNTNPQQWPTDPWEVAKIFQPHGCQGHSSPTDCDAAAILTLIKDCTHFHQFVSNVAILQVIKDIRNRTMHNNDMLVDDTATITYIDTIIQLLQDPVHLVNLFPCQEAVMKITELRDNIIDLSLNRELELNVLHQRTSALQTDVGQLKHEYKTLSEEVDNKTEKKKLNENVDTIKTANERTKTICEELIQKIEKLEEMNVYMNSISKEMETFAMFINTNEIDVQQIKATLQENKNDIQQLLHKVEHNDRVLRYHELQIQDLKTYVKKLATEVQQENGTMQDCHYEGLERQMASLENQQTIHQTVDPHKLNRKLAEGKQRLDHHIKRLEKLHMFNITRLTTIVINQIQDQHIAVLTGIPGVGKTHIALNTLKELTESCPDVQPLMFCDPEKNEVEELIDPSKRSILLLDDFLGRVNVDLIKVAEWNKYVNTLMSYIKAKKVFVVVTIRKVILNKCSNAFVNKMFKKKWVIDLDKNELNVDEKKTMITAYAKCYDVKLLESDMDSLVPEMSHGIGFPLLCRVMKGKDIVSLFSRPVEVLKKDIIRMEDEDPSSFVCLLMTMFCNKTLTTAIFSGNEARCFKEIQKYFETQKIDHRSIMVSAKALLQTYLKVAEDAISYEFVHDAVLESTFQAAKEYIPHILITFCPIEILIKFTPSISESKTEFEEPEKSRADTSLYQQIIQRFKSLIASTKSSTQIKSVAELRLWRNSAFIQMALQHISPDVFFQEDNNETSLVVYFAGFGYVELIKHIDIETYNIPLLLNVHTKKTQYEKAMIQACTFGNTKSVSHFITKRITINVEMMFAAVKGGNTKILQMLLDRGGSIKSQRNETNKNLLHEACLYDNVDMAKYILSRCDENLKVKLLAAETVGEKLKPIMTALKRSSFQMFQIMVSSGSDITCVNTYGQNCLILSAYQDGLECLMYLLEQGVDPVSTDNEGYTVLHQASFNGKLDILKYLCDNYKDLIKMTNNHKATAAHAAASNGQLECLVYLIEQGIDPESKSGYGNTVLHRASACGRLSVVKYLCDIYKDIIKMTNNLKATAAHEAAESGQLECLVYLIEQGIDPEARNDNGRTVLHIASGCGQLNVVQYLCDNYKDLIKMTNNLKATAAHEAAEGGQLECLVYLIEQGIDPEARNGYDDTVLHRASACGQLNVVQYLCDNYKDLIKMTNNNKATAAYEAAESGQLECLVYLIEQGIDPESKTGYGNTVLHRASACGRLSVVKYLCDIYKDIIKMTNNLKATAAHEAAGSGQLECLIYLIEQGIDPEARNDNGRTVLHRASACGQLNVVQYLCDNYKDLIKMTNNHKATAAHEAAEGGQLECLVYLIEQGIDPEARNGYDDTVLHRASACGQLNVVQYLCDNYNDLIKMTNNNKATAAYEAAESGQLECLVYLIEQGIDLEARNGYGNTVLHRASACGELNVVKYLCDNYKDMIKMTNNHKATAAYEAARSGQLECLVYLIDQGIDLEARNGYGNTVLHRSSACGELNVVKYLCDNYKDLIKMTNNDKATAAHEAASNGQLECLVYLIEQGIDPEARNGYGNTVLHIASACGRLSVVKYLCDIYKDIIKMTNNLKATAAHEAAGSGQLECLVYLIEQGIDPEARNDNGRTVLHRSSAYGQLNVVQYLCENYKDLIKMTNNLKATAAHEAAEGGQLECLVYLIEQGIDPEARNGYDDTVLHRASACGELNVVKYLCDNYKDLIKMTNNHKATAAYEAARSGQLECLVYLIDQGIDLEARNGYGNTVLHRSSACGELNVVKYLCDNYKDLIKMTNNHKATAAYEAAGSGQLECLVYLIEQGIDPEARNDNGRTVLHRASACGQLNVVQYLCDNYKDLIKMTNNHKATAAHEAAEGGQLECLVYLIEQGIDPEARNGYDDTVLHRASACGQLNVVQYLCDNYNDLIKMTNNNKATAAYEAAESGQLECLVYLIEQGIDLEARNGYGNTVLHRASACGELNVVKYLCDNYKDMIKMTNNHKATAAYEAARSGQLECLVYLIDQGIDLEARNGYGNTVLHRSSACGELNVVKYLCDNYKDLIKMTNNDKATAAHEAASNGQLECLVYLIEQGIDPEARNGYGNTVLHIASACGRLSVVKYLCDIYKDIIKMTNNLKATAAHEAAGSGQLECLVYLIEQGIDPEARNDNGRTVLHRSSAYGQLNVVQYLCENYKDLIKMTNNLKATAAHEAAEGGQLECLVYLIEQGIDPEARNGYDDTVLHRASACGELNVVKYLCDNYKDLIKMTNNHKATAAYEAARSGQLECLVYLIDQGIDLEARNGYGNTVLHRSSACGELNVVKYLCDNYNDLIKMTNNDKATAAYEAASNGQIECLVYLIKQGIDPEARNGYGNTVLHIASACGRLSVVKYLCDIYKDIIKMTNNLKATAAHEAAGSGQLECLVYLIEQGIDPEARNGYGNTVLHIASACGRLSVVKYLCDIYKDIIKMTNNLKATAAHEAAGSGQLECLVYLIEQGINPEARNDNGRTVLHRASACGQLNVVQYLCDNYKDLIKMTNNLKATAAHEAAEGGQLECLVYLMEQGIYPDARNGYGNTVLHRASASGRLNVVKYLCKNYKNLIKMKNNDKATAAHEAARNGQLECLGYLKL